MFVPISSYHLIGVADNPILNFALLNKVFLYIGLPVLCASSAISR